MQRWNFTWKFISGLTIDEAKHFWQRNFLIKFPDCPISDLSAVFQRIFNYRTWQSVSQLQSFLSRPTREVIEKAYGKVLLRHQKQLSSQCDISIVTHYISPFVVFCSLCLVFLFHCYILMWIKLIYIHCPVLAAFLL